MSSLLLRPLRKRRHRAGLAALSGLLLVTGCTDYGGDLSGASISGGGDGDTVVVSETAGTPSAFLAYGVREGFFEDEGLNVEVRPSSGGASVIPALLSGDIDIAGSNVVSALLAMGRRMPIEMIAAGTSTSERADDDFSSLMVPADSPIAGPEDLDGAKIAVNTLQNINDIVLHSVLAEHGLGNGDVQLVEMPFPDMPAAMDRGDVDAGLLIEPFATIGRGAGLRDIARPYTATRPNLQIGTYLMTGDEIGEDPELARAFRAGVEATAESIARDPQSFRDALPEISELAPELAAQIDLPDWQGVTDRGSIETIHAVMRDIGLTDAELDYDEAVYE
ncbi:ABC transporter substrate-binding protein [Streptomyces avicenniae]|uniref:ABC transporter substrate-binding protein n=1 Tax=Streptomyces avicenniae TaxID=500153 RepID=UPI00069B4BDB|nr:ABC transporter substrate-binding protein [Streptomyces avicenniae]